MLLKVVLHTVLVFVTGGLWLIPLAIWAIFTALKK